MKKKIFATTLIFCMVFNIISIPIPFMTSGILTVEAAEEEAIIGDEFLDSRDSLEVFVYPAYYDKMDIAFSDLSAAERDRYIRTLQDAVGAEGSAYVTGDRNGIPIKHSDLLVPIYNKSNLSELLKTNGLTTDEEDEDHIFIETEADSIKMYGLESYSSNSKYWTSISSSVENYQYLVFRNSKYTSSTSDTTYNVPDLKLIERNYPGLIEDQDAVKVVESEDGKKQYIILSINEDIRAAMLETDESMVPVEFLFKVQDPINGRGIIKKNTGELDDTDLVDEFTAPIIRINDNYFSREEQIVDADEDFPLDTLPANTLVVQIPDEYVHEDQTAYVITRITNVEKDSQVQFWGYPYSEIIPFVPIVETTCSITDIVGNPLEIDYQDGVTVDFEAPDVAEFGVYGLNDEDTTDGFGEGIDKAELYRTADDQVEFYIDLDEACEFSISDIKLSGFFSDEANEDVSVVCIEEYLIDSSVDGRKRHRLIFEPLVIPEGADAINEEDLLLPTKIEGSIKDENGNIFINEGALDPSKNQTEIIIDAKKPTISLEKIEGSDDVITFKVVVEDEGSGIAVLGGASFIFELFDQWRDLDGREFYELEDEYNQRISAGESLSFNGKAPYKLCINNSSDTPGDEEFFDTYTLIEDIQYSNDSTNEVVTVEYSEVEHLLGVSESQPIYMHIKVDETSKVFYNGGIKVTAKDIAGNQTTEVSNDFEIDEAQPSIQLVSKEQKLLDANTVKFETDLSIAENSDNATIYYTWVKKDESCPSELTDWSSETIVMEESMKTTRVDSSGSGPNYQKHNYTYPPAEYTIEYYPNEEGDDIYEYTLYVEVMDENGNSSGRKEYAFYYDIRTVANTYTINSDLEEILVEKPNIVIAAPEEEDAITFVNVEFSDGDKYVALLTKNDHIGDIIDSKPDIISTTGSAIIFGGELETTSSGAISVGTGLNWYKGSGEYNENNLTWSFGNSADFDSAFELQYGDVNVTLITVNDSEFTMDSASDSANIAEPSVDTFDFQYAGNPDADVFYEIPKTDGGYYITLTDSNGDDLNIEESEVNHRNEQIKYAYISDQIAGIHVKFSINNVVNTDFELADLDFDNSYIEVIKINTNDPKAAYGSFNLDGDDSDEVVGKMYLQNSLNQDILLPNINLDGDENGLYAFRITLKKIGNDANEWFNSLSNGANTLPYLLLDKHEIENFGFYQYTTELSNEHFFDYEKPSKEFNYDTPPNVINISLADDADSDFSTNRTFIVGYENIENDDDYFDTSSAVDNYTKNYDVNLGVCRRMRIWNKNDSADGTGIDWVETDGNTANYGRWEISADDSRLNLAEGENTVYMQVEIYGKKQSKIKEITINVNKNKPIIDLSTETINNTSINGISYVSGTTINLESAKSDNGAVETYLYKYEESKFYGGSGKIRKIYETYYDGDYVYYDDDGNVTTETGVKNELSFPYDTYEIMSGEVLDVETNSNQIMVLGVDDLGAYNYVFPDTMPDDDEKSLTLEDLGFGTNELADGGLWYPIPRLISEYEYPIYKLYLPEGAFTLENGEETDRYDFINKIVIEFDGEETVLFNNGSFLNEERSIFIPENGVYKFEYNYNNGEESDEYGDKLVPTFTYTPEYDQYAESTIEHTASIKFTSKLGETKEIQFENSEDGGYWNLDLDHYNMKPSVESIDKQKLTFNLPVKVTSPTPMDSVNAYETQWDNLPMFSSGSYDIVFQDVYGNEYTEIVDIDLDYDALFDVSYSTLEPTNGDLTISLDVPDDRAIIDRITYLDASGNEVETSETISSTLSDGNDEASITFTENGTIFVYVTEQTNPVEFNVLNIDKEISGLNIEWTYDGVEIDDSTFYGNVFAEVYSINETIYPKDEGAIEYAFTDSTPYIFTVVDSAGNQASVEAVPKYTTIIPSKYETPEVESDSPIVTITSTAKINNIYGEVNSIVLRADSNGVDDDTYFTSLQLAQAYRLEASHDDESSVKYIWKNYQTSDISYSTVSDSIDGLYENGHSFDITEAINAYLYVVDEHDNYTSILIDLRNVIDSEGPEMPTVLEEINGATVRAFLIPQEGDVFTCTNAEMDTPVNGDQPYYYHDYTDNEPFTFTLYDEIGNTTMFIYVPLTFDSDSPILLVKWSDNNSTSSFTNEDITATITANKDIKAAMITQNNGDPVDTSLADINVTSDSVVITFKDNPSEAIIARVTSINGSYTEVQLMPNAVIDRTELIVTLESDELAGDLSSRTYTFKANKEVSFGQGIYSYSDDGSLTQKTNFYVNESIVAVVDENGECTFRFADEVGNLKELTYTATGIDNDPLIISFSNSQSGSNSVDDINELNLEQSIYFKANREVIVKCSNDESTYSYLEDVWTELDINLENQTTYPLVTFSHQKGTSLLRELFSITEIELEDTIAPVIELDSTYIKVNHEISVDDLTTILMDNMFVSDVNKLRETVVYEDDIENKGITVTISDLPEYSEVNNYDLGVWEIAYNAVDEAGNTTSKTCYLNFFELSDISVEINGNTVLAEEAIVVYDEENTLTVTCYSGQPYSIYVKSGYKTEAQVKVNSKRVAYQLAGNNTFELPNLENDWTTILIRTQDRKSYVYYVFYE